MNFNRKKIAILIIVVALLILLFIFYLILKQRRERVLVVNKPASSQVVKPKAPLPYSLPVNSSSSQVKASSTTNNYIKVNKTHQLTANDLGKIAMAFSERIGSFSNQSGYTNIADLKIMMTDSMRTWANTYIKELRDKYQNNGAFYSITTHALLFKVNSFNQDTGTGEITVTTQRSIQNANLKNQAKPYNQKMKVVFKKVNGQWLIDGAYWQK